MGIFDFLKGRDAPVAGQVGPGGLMQPPTMEHQPGFIERSRTPDATGQSLADRILMATMVLNDQGPQAAQYGMRLKQSAKDAADRTRKNAALKAAYQNGKFDPNAYMAALGDQGDATEALSLAKELAPRTGVDGSFAYSIDPITGDVHWGEQRAPSHAEEARAAKDAADEEHQRSMEAYYAAMAKAALTNAGAREYTAHRPRAAGAAVTVPALPPGFVMEK